MQKGHPHRGQSDLLEHLPPDRVFWRFAVVDSTTRQRPVLRTIMTSARAPATFANHEDPAVADDDRGGAATIFHRVIIRDNGVSVHP